MAAAANFSTSLSFTLAGRFFLIHLFPFSAIISHSSFLSPNLPINSARARAVAHNSFPSDVPTAIAAGHPVIKESRLFSHRETSWSVRSQAPEAFCNDITDITPEASFFDKLEGGAAFLDGSGGRAACCNVSPNGGGGAPGCPPPYIAAASGGGGGGAPPKKVDDCDLNLATPAGDFKHLAPRRVEEPLNDNPEPPIPFG